MTQTSRRPLRRQRRKSPLPFIILIIAALVLCLTAFSCNRINTSADKAYAALIEPDSHAATLESLAQTYENLDKQRLQDGISEDYDAVIKRSEQMNTILDQLVKTQHEIDDGQAKKTDAFKKAARWLLFGTARSTAAEEIIGACDAITRLQAEEVALRRENNKLLRDRNNLYIKYCRDEISTEEFSEMKAAVDDSITPVVDTLNKQYDSINTQAGIIAAKSGTFGG